MVAFVTGTSSGFGAAIARRFAKDGMRVVATARRIEKLTPLKQEFGDLILPVALDVRDRLQVDSIVAGLPAEFSAIDVLVNNAGLSLNLEPAYRVPIEDWETMVDTNIKGLLYCTRLILPGMVARGRGHVVNIGSVAAMYAYPGGNVYGATKAFVKQFSHNLRADLLGTAVRVTDIEPGLAETEFSVVRFKGDEQRAASIYKGTQPLTAGDIAARFEISKPSVSKHLSILENAGLVRSERRGQFIHYSLVRDNLVNTLNGYVQEVCPVSKPLKRESKARAAGRIAGS